MHIKRHMWKADLQIVLVAVLALCAAAFVPIDSAEGKFKMIYAFRGRPDGAVPLEPLIRKAQTLYGTTARGGAHNDGTIFKLAPDGTESVLYSFSGSDGIGPNGLIVDRAGNFYGTAEYGGTDDDGTVFKLAPDGTLATLYTFTGGSDGADPEGVIADKVGNLYGTTQVGGTYNCGTVFDLAPDGALTTLYSFTCGNDGWNPHGLIRDQSHNLYGTTLWGGADGLGGTVFKLAPDGTLITLHSFAGGSDGTHPHSGVIMDEAGDLYGTTDYGGAYGWGTIFKLAPDGTETVLHSFANSDGIVPNGLMMDEAGNLYGMTQADGDGGDGTVYKLAPDGIYTVLHSFRTNKDGGRPVGTLIMGHGGKLYGTASTGGPHGGGTVFRLNPPDSAAAAEDER